MDRLVVYLKGGLGNQMFQYAAGRALALKNGMQLVLDVNSGFARDKVFRRSFSLGDFSLNAKYATIMEQWPYWYKRLQDRLFSGTARLVQEYPWGIYLNETEIRFHDVIQKINTSKYIFMDGYWQSERYFADFAGVIAKEFEMPTPSDPLYLSMAKKIESCNSVCVGVRLFEELPGADKAGVGGVTPFSFYKMAAERLAESVRNPEYFLFCTTRSAIDGKIKLPGKIHYITCDDGFINAIDSLWLTSRCAHHIISNSSFYWWGAWLAERHNPGNLKIVCDQFAMKDTIPERWKKIVQ